MPAETKRPNGSKPGKSKLLGSQSPRSQPSSRGPWVALLVAALLGGGAAWMHDSTKQAVSHFDERRAEVRQYFDEHLYLTLDRDLEKLLDSSQFARRRLYLEDSMSGEAVAELKLRAQQSQLAGLVREAAAAEALLPAGLYGVRSTSDPPSRLFAHAAAHPTGVALCLTLIVLMAAGMALENAWGHIVFALFCAASTAGMALARAASAPAYELPWAGSSGLAVALLGAYLALTLRGVARYYGGMLSGWLLVPLWVAAQYAMVHHFWEPGFDQSLVFIHSVGAGAGFAVATLLSAIGLERRADGSAEEKATPAARAIGQARRAQNSGQEGHAFSLLRAEATRSPGNAEIVAALWGLAKELGQEDAAAPAVVALVKHALREDRADEAAKLWMDLVAAGVRANVEPAILVCIGEALLDEGHATEALAAMRRAAGADEPVASALALRILHVARDLDPDLTRVSAKIALADPRLPAAKREALWALAEGAATASGRAPGPAASAEAAEPLSPAAPRALEPAAPVSLESPSRLEDDVAEIEALDPDALSEDALSDFFGADSDEDVEVDADEIAAWNDPGMLGDLSAESVDEEMDEAFDAGSSDTLTLDFQPGEIGEPIEAIEAIEPVAPVEADETTLSHTQDVIDTAVQFESPRRSLKVVHVIPVAFEADGLALDVEGQGKTCLPYRRIEAVAVAAIEGAFDRAPEASGAPATTRGAGGSGQAGRPIIVLDLVLDWKSYDGEHMRVLRIRCDSFDPRQLVPAASPLEALKLLVDKLLGHSDATPLPDPQGARGNPFARFQGLDAYEADVLGADSAQP